MPFSQSLARIPGSMKLCRDDISADTVDIPLVLDVDGTLLRTDLLYETFWAALGHDIPATLRALASGWARPARQKWRLRQIAEPDIALLPVRDPVVKLARRAAQQGRAVHLVSAADQDQVDAVAQRLDLPGAHFGSDDARNLTDAAKAAFLTDRFGEQGYDYAGNSRADLDSWRHARKIIAVAPDTVLVSRLTKTGRPVEIVDDRWTLSALIRELRPHQWVKNLLLFLPLLAAHVVEPAAVLPVVLAVLAFSFGASAIYIVNDLLDLDADRRHPEKRHRPIASGALPIPVAMVASALLGVSAVGLALAIGPLVALLTGGYMLGSLVYSLWLKRRRWADLFALAGLYLLRVLAGAAAAQTGVSLWLLGFVLAVFFTLACVKRMNALARALITGNLPGRGYGKGDLKTLERAALPGIAAAAASFLSYAFSPAATALYSTPALLALAVVPIVFWLLRIVKLSELGREDYDPVVFVSHDRLGLSIAVAGLALVVLAI